MLKAIYHKYVSAQGDQPSQLDVYMFNGLENNLYEKVPEILLEPLRSNIRPMVDNRYLLNLKDLEYIKEKHNSGMCVFTLTKSGYCEAKRLNRPCKYFIDKHWKFLLGSVLSFITALTAIIRYIQC